MWAVADTTAKENKVFKAKKTEEKLRVAKEQTKQKQTLDSVAEVTLAPPMGGGG